MRKVSRPSSRALSTSFEEAPIREDMMEPCFDIAHLAHVEMLTDRFEESLDFFTRIYGLKLSG